MKIVGGIRGGQHHPHTLDDGSQYDSILNIQEDGRIIHAANFCNTDYRAGYAGKGGILAEGHYGFICINHDRLGKSLYLFDLKYYDEVQTIDDCYREYGILPSLIPNPNHAGAKIITQVLIHRGGTITDNSDGCQTIEPIYYDGFMSFFQINEKGEYWLERDPAWVAPAFYQGQ